MGLLFAIACWVAVGVFGWQLYKKGEAPPAPLIIQGKTVELGEARATAVMVDGQLAGTLIELPDDRTWTFLQRPGLICDATQFERMEQSLDYGVKQYLKSQASVEYVSGLLAKHREALLQKMEPLPVATSDPGRAPNLP